MKTTNIYRLQREMEDPKGRSEVLDEATKGPSVNKITRLIQLSLEAKEFSYSPYSNFRVGAALLAHDETIFTGEKLLINT